MICFNRYVLSAAHCANKDYVRLGEWKIVDPDVYNSDTCSYYNDISKMRCLDGGPVCSKFNCEKGDANKDCITNEQGGQIMCAPEHQVRNNSAVKIDLLPKI